jgi:hypothetical protein
VCSSEAGSVTQACVFVPAEKLVMEQRINIKFCAKLGKKSVSKTLQMLTEAYGADAMKSLVSLSGIKGLKIVGKT